MRRRWRAQVSDDGRRCMHRNVLVSYREKIHAAHRLSEQRASRKDACAKLQFEAGWSLMIFIGCGQSPGH